MLEPFLIVVKSVGVISEELNGDRKEVIKIHGARCAEASLIFVVNLRDFSVKNAVGSFECCVGGYEFVFEVGDVCVNASSNKFFVIETQVAHNISGEAGRVGVGVD